jgi:hypothetical protein
LSVHALSNNPLGEFSPNLIEEINFAAAVKLKNSLNNLGNRIQSTYLGMVSNKVYEFFISRVILSKGKATFMITITLSQ